MITSELLHQLRTQVTPFFLENLSSEYSILLNPQVDLNQEMARVVQLLILQHIKAVTEDLESDPSVFNRLFSPTFIQNFFEIHRSIIESTPFEAVLKIYDSKLCDVESQYLLNERRKRPKRQDFLKNLDKQHPQQAHLFDVNNFVQYYQHKYKIRMLLNTQHPASSRYAAIQSRLERLHDCDEKLGAFLSENYVTDERLLGYKDLFCISDFHDYGSINQSLHAKLKLALPKKFFTTEGFKEQLTAKDKLELNASLNSPLFVTLRQSLEELIQLEIKLLPLVGYGYKVSEASLEMKQICASLNQNEAVGYVYTGVNAENMRYQGYDHIEVFILQHQAIIRPVSWPKADMITTEQLEQRFDSDLCVYTPPHFRLLSNNPLSPQADTISCAQLGVFYLKKLLKNNANALLEESLMFTYYDAKERAVGLFIPSPRVMHYSQSRAYNDALYAMMSGTDTYFSMNVRQDSLRHHTVEFLLRQSIDIAREQENLTLMQKNQELLEKLPAFRERWLNIANTEKEKHESMQAPGDVGNQYLLYRARGLFKKSSPVDCSSPTLSFL